ncbi:hypothetical protein MTBSS4_240059 [Magnetospirillum sp. SS-4]|nr:hypothetical protein MTBSS4_240059 [Magnetospirillum sp. SS-4]
MRRFPRRGFPLSNPFHSELEMLQLRLQRAVNHTGADLHHQTAQQTGIDLDLDGDIAAERRLEGGDEGVVLGRRQRHRGRHHGGLLATAGGEPAQIGFDHPRKGEQAAVSGRQPQEFRCQLGKAAGLGNGGDRPALFRAAEHGAVDEAAQIGAVADHDLQRLEVAGHLIEGGRRIGQIEKGGGVAGGDYANCLGWHLGKSLNRVEPAAVTY